LLTMNINHYTAIDYILSKKLIRVNISIFRYHVFVTTMLSELEILVRKQCL
jgi:hypothetical protein